MSFTITLDSPELQELARKFPLAREELENRIRPHTETKDYMSKRWKINFDSDGSIYGAWEAHHEPTIDLYGPHKLLEISGALKSGLFAQAESPTILSRDETSWIFQKNPIYLFAHHFGMANTSRFALVRHFGAIPARPLWGLNGEDETHITKIFDDYCDDVVRRYF